MKIEAWQIKQRQSLPLDIKIEIAKNRIREFYNHMNGNVYVGYSGGIDSTALLHLVRSVYPKVEAVFANTRMEYPEIVKHVRNTENVKWVYPKKQFKDVCTEYGYPVISKRVSMGIDRYHTTNDEYQKELRLNGGINPTSGKKQNRSIPIKYKYLIDAPFKCSEKCCYYMKKAPMKTYEKETGNKPFIGTMVSNSNARMMAYMKTGCNVFSDGKERSIPISTWTDDDVWEYIQKYNIPYSKIYDMGEHNTGCMYCMFGIMHDGTPNRFERMEQTHPIHYKYAMKIGIGDVLDYMNIPY